MNVPRECVLVEWLPAFMTDEEIEDVRLTFCDKEGSCDVVEVHRTDEDTLVGLDFHSATLAAKVASRYDKSRFKGCLIKATTYSFNKEQALRESPEPRNVIFQSERRYRAPFPDEDEIYERERNNEYNKGQADLRYSLQSRRSFQPDTRAVREEWIKTYSDVPLSPHERHPNDGPLYPGRNDFEMDYNSGRGGPLHPLAPCDYPRRVNNYSPMFDGEERDRPCFQQQSNNFRDFRFDNRREVWSDDEANDIWPRRERDDGRGFNSNSNRDFRRGFRFGDEHLSSLTKDISETRSSYFVDEQDFSTGRQESGVGARLISRKGGRLSYTYPKHSRGNKLNSKSSKAFQFKNNRRNAKNYGPLKNSFQAHEKDKRLSNNAQTNDSFTGRCRRESNSQNKNDPTKPNMTDRSCSNGDSKTTSTCSALCYNRQNSKEKSDSRGEAGGGKSIIESKEIKNNKNNGIKDTDRVKPSTVQGKGKDNLPGTCKSLSIATNKTTIAPQNRICTNNSKISKLQGKSCNQAGTKEKVDKVADQCSNTSALPKNSSESSLRACAIADDSVSKISKVPNSAETGEKDSTSKKPSEDRKCALTDGSNRMTADKVSASDKAKDEDSVISTSQNQLIGKEQTPLATSIVTSSVSNLPGSVVQITTSNTGMCMAAKTQCKTSTADNLHYNSKKISETATAASLPPESNKSTETSDATALPSVCTVLSKESSTSESKNSIVTESKLTKNHEVGRNPATSSRTLTCNTSNKVTSQESQSKVCSSQKTTTAKTSKPVCLLEKGAKVSTSESSASQLPSNVSTEKTVDLAAECKLTTNNRASSFTVQEEGMITIPKDSFTEKLSGKSSEDRNCEALLLQSGLKAEGGKPIGSSLENNEIVGVKTSSASNQPKASGTEDSKLPVPCVTESALRTNEKAPAAPDRVENQTLVHNSPCTVRELPSAVSTDGSTKTTSSPLKDDLSVKEGKSSSYSSVLTPSTETMVMTVTSADIATPIEKEDVKKANIPIPVVSSTEGGCSVTLNSSSVAIKDNKTHGMECNVTSTKALPTTVKSTAKVSKECLTSSLDVGCQQDSSMLASHNNLSPPRKAVSSRRTRRQSSPSVKMEQTETRVTRSCAQSGTKQHTAAVSQRLTRSHNGDRNTDNVENVVKKGAEDRFVTQKMKSDDTTGVIEKLSPKTRKSTVSPTMSGDNVNNNVAVKYMEKQLDRPETEGQSKIMSNVSCVPQMNLTKELSEPLTPPMFNELPSKTRSDSVSVYNTDLRPYVAPQLDSPEISQRISKVSVDPFNLTTDATSKESLDIALEPSDWCFRPISPPIKGRKVILQESPEHSEYGEYSDFGSKAQSEISHNISRHNSPISPFLELADQDRLMNRLDKPTSFSSATNQYFEVHELRKGKSQVVEVKHQQLLPLDDENFINIKQSKVRHKKKFGADLRNMLNKTRTNRTGDDFELTQIIDQGQQDLRFKLRKNNIPELTVLITQDCQGTPQTEAVTHTIESRTMKKKRKHTEKEVDEESRKKKRKKKRARDLNSMANFPIVQGSSVLTKKELKKQVKKLARKAIYQEKLALESENKVYSWTTSSGDLLPFGSNTRPDDYANRLAPVRTLSDYCSPISDDELTTSPIKGTSNEVFKEMPSIHGISLSFNSDGTSNSPHESKSLKRLRKSETGGCTDQELLAPFPKYTKVTPFEEGESYLGQETSLSSYRKGFESLPVHECDTQLHAPSDQVNKYLDIEPEDQSSAEDIEMGAEATTDLPPDNNNNIKLEVFDGHSKCKSELHLIDAKDDKAESVLLPTDGQQQKDDLFIPSAKGQSCTTYDVPLQSPSSEKITSISDSGNEGSRQFVVDQANISLCIEQLRAEASLPNSNQYSAATKSNCTQVSTAIQDHTDKMQHPILQEIPCDRKSTCTSDQRDSDDNKIDQKEIVNSEIDQKEIDKSEIDQKEIEQSNTECDNIDQNRVDRNEPSSMDRSDQTDDSQQFIPDSSDVFSKPEENLNVDQEINDKASNSSSEVAESVPDSERSCSTVDIFMQDTDSLKSEDEIYSQISSASSVEYQTNTETEAMKDNPALTSIDLEATNNACLDKQKTRDIGNEILDQYSKDCRAITVVVSMLLRKMPDMEDFLAQGLADVLDELGDECVREFRSQFKPKEILSES